MPILTDADRARLQQARRDTLRDDLRKPEVYRIGKLLPGDNIEVYPPGLPGNVWVRRLGDNVGEAVPALYSGEPIDPNAYVEVVPYRGKLRVRGLAPEDAIRRDGVPLRPQAPIDLSQLDYGLLRPSSPPSFRAIITEAYRNLSGTIYRTRTGTTKDFSGDVPGSGAIGVQITLDPATGTLSYTSSGSFSAGLTLAQAFADYLTKTVPDTEFLIGYVRLYAGQTAIVRDDILTGQEILAKTGGSGDPFTDAIYAPGLGFLVTSTGELVTVS